MRLHFLNTVSLPLGQQLVAQSQILPARFVAGAGDAAQLRFQPHRLFKLAAARNFDTSPVLRLRRVQHIADNLRVGRRRFDFSTLVFKHYRGAVV